MKNNSNSKVLSFVLLFVLIAAVALALAACSKDESGKTEDTVKKTVTVDVIDDKGETKTFEIKTDGDTLYDALIQEKLIEGEDGEYGFFIKTVNGLRADYEKDGAYWELDDEKGEMLMTGVETTEISDGDRYKLVYKGADEWQ